MLMFGKDEKNKLDSKEKGESKRKKSNIAFILGIVGAVLFIAAAIAVVYTLRKDREDAVVKKPVLYLYPEEASEVSVKLNFDGITAAYPEYKNKWEVIAYPDGTVIDHKGNEYSYLFWEANTDAEFDFSEGFCVKGSETAEFLRWALSEQGLTPREYNEFIVYWFPLMKDNPYNIISFQGQLYEESAPVEIYPAPDNIKRIFMAYYPSRTEKEITPQKLTGFERSGFTVVEWGGACVK